MLDWLHIATAGLWPLVWKFGIGGAVIIGLLAAAWFSPVWKTHFLWGAALVGAIMIAFSTGVKDGSSRVHAQWDRSLEAEAMEGKTARRDAESVVRSERPDSGVLRDDPRNRDNWPK